MKIGSFDVLKAMVDEDNKGITLAPLNNLVRAKKTKHGTEVTIGVGGDVIAGIMRGDYVGGLLLADKKAFDVVRTRLDFKLNREHNPDFEPRLEPITLTNHTAKCKLCFKLEDGTPVLCADGLKAAATP